jgi:primosomal replication protein N
MEHNAVRLSGLVKDVKSARTSPAGVVHHEFVLEHRSRQELDGMPREVRAEVAVKVTGRTLAKVVASLQPGDRVIVDGLLAQASHRDTQQLLIHAQAIERFE